MVDAISDHYRNQLLKLHQAKHSFGTKAWYKGIDTWIEKVKPASIIDYGCGKGMLLESIKTRYQIEGIGYDPGVIEFMQTPTQPADALVCTDVLEHIEPPKIDNVLAHIDSLFTKSAWLLIDTQPAIKNLADGRNAHLILENQEWWTDKVKSVMTKSNIVVNRFKKGKIIMELEKNGTDTNKS
jgi:2-polyprenyl-3-methyl-5-hydroxy-6-metoxy-1,4-benzoquinol methylase